MGSKFGILAETGNNIQTEGLVFYVDSSIKKSYPRTGTNVFNLASGSLTPTGSLINDVGWEGINPTSSFIFDGTDDYINCGDSDTFSFGNGSTDSPFSISTWVNMTNATTFRIVTKYDTSAKEYFFATDSTDKVLFRLYDNSTGGILGRRYETALTSFQGQWIHLAATYDGSGNNSGLKIYLNGAQVDNANVNSGTYTAMENTSQPLEIGKLTSTNANGKIANTQIYTKVLLTSDVLQNYNAGKDTFGL
jgi:hypothetical protein